MGLVKTFIIQNFISSHPFDGGIISECLQKRVAIGYNQTHSGLKITAQEMKWQNSSPMYFNKKKLSSI
jgi:hypothetical protein